MLFPSNPKPKNLCYNPGFPASATYDDVSHSTEAGLCQTFREKNICSQYHRQTFAKPSPSILVVLSHKFLTRTFWSTTISGSGFALVGNAVSAAILNCNPSWACVASREETGYLAQHVMRLIGTACHAINWHSMSCDHQPGVMAL